MQDISTEQEHLLVGVKRKSDKEPDYSSALHVMDDAEANRRVYEIRFETIVEEAMKVGLQEDKLRMIIHRLSNRNSTTIKKGIIEMLAKEYGLESQAMLDLVRRYQKERIRMIEKGDIFHYHQMSAANFESAVSSGGLLSHNMLKDLGKASPDSGSRPDVVQMTRDKFDTEGNIIEPGLVSGTGIGASAEVALVFEPSVMDLPYYDSIDMYPNLPTVPLDMLNTILVRKGSSKKHITEIIEKYSLQVPIKLREEWARERY